MNKTNSSSLAASLPPFLVKAARLKIQNDYGLNITDAQTFCAAIVHKKTRAWQQWEEGARKMDIALYELFLIKTRALK